MSKLMMLAGGIAEPGGGKPGSVSAYVVYSAGHASRLFKVKGPSTAPAVSELAAATTIDLKRFQTELAADLAPALDELRKAGGPGAVAAPSDAWVCGVVRAHLKSTEGLEVE
jgi:hypothetical protein